MIQRRKIAPWGIPIIAAAFLAACAAVLPAAAGERPIVAPQTSSTETMAPQAVSHIEAPQIAKCYPNLKAASEALWEIYAESPLVGLWRKGTLEKPNWVMTIFVNTDTGTWTVTQSDSKRTCFMADAEAGHGGTIFAIHDFIENTRPDTES